MQFFNRLFALLLHLYPRRYRDEYGAELQLVFQMSLEDAFKTGGWEPAKVMLRELSSLPKAVLIQHLRERRKANMTNKLSTYFHFAHGSLQEFFSALCPFVLIGVVSPLSTLLIKNGFAAGSMVVNVFGAALFCAFGILFLAGLISGAPRWFLPYVGFLLSLLSVYGFSMLMEKWNVIPFPTLYARSWILGHLAYQGFLWIGLTLIALLTTLLFVLLPVFPRFKKDWTLLSFVLYGACPFALMITFDDYVNDELATFLAFMILMAGIWFYLRMDTARLKFWVLFGGMTVSLLFAAVSKAIIYQYYWEGIRHFTWWTEMMSTVIMWGWLALTMLIPLVLSGKSPQIRSTPLAGVQE